MIILHLSDIHFGRNNPKYNVEGIFDNKQIILNDLLTSIKGNTLKPEHIVVTGDIAWFGKKEDFDEALIWFRKLLKITNLTGADITFCPGNHDVNRSYGNYKTNLNYNAIKTIDEIYCYDNIHRMESPLYNYNKFCEELGIVPYHYPKFSKWEASYAIGYKDIVSGNNETLRLVSFNTALLSFIKDYPGDQMLIGQSQVIDLFKHNIIGDNRNHFTIALFHHAERFLHINEICEYDHRSATLPLLRRYVDLVLCGHTETGGIPVLYRQVGGAEMLTGGAAYYSDDHANSYSIIIVPNAFQGKDKREICFLPFTYSSKNGWHQNCRAPSPIQDKTIVSKQPNFNCRSDFKLILSYDDKKISIPMKCVSFYVENDNTAVLNNYEDVCRNLDICCTAPTNSPGEATISICIAPSRENSVEAILCCEKVFSFLSSASKFPNGSSFKIIDDTDQVLLYGENITCNENIDGKAVEFLSKLRRIELNYDLIFQCPNDNSEHKKVDILSDLIDLGYTTSLKAIKAFETYSANRKQLFKIGILSLMNKPIYILHSGTFRCRLYGNDFNLGKVSVLMGPYTAKGSKSIYKSLTYTEHDKRRINLKLCDNSICYLVSDSTKLNMQKLIKELGKYIEVENMECIWDFIYEVN